MTTKICTKCNTEKDLIEFGNLSTTKDGKQFRCKECRNLSARESIQRGDSNHKEVLKKSYQKHKEKRLKEKAEYRENNRRLLADKQKEYYRENKEECIEYQKKYRAYNKERIRDYWKMYRATEQGKTVKRNSDHKRRTLTKNGDVTVQQLKELYSTAKNCYWCNTKLNKNNTHLDHFMPLSKGGEHTLTNLVVSCSTCNLQKNAKDPLEYANKIGRLL